MLTTQSIDPNARPPRFFLIRWLIALWHWILPPSQAHSDRESDFTRNMRATVIIGGCIVAITCAIIYARPLGKRYRQYQADGFLEKAKTYADTGDIPSAVINAQRAYVAAPDYEPGVRLNAQLLTVMRRNEALVYWDRLEKKGVANLEDLQGKVRALLHNNQGRDAKQLLENLIKGNPTDKHLLSLAEEVWGKQQTNRVVLDVLGRYCKEHPDDRDNFLRLCRMQAMSGVPEDYLASREGLWKLAEGKDSAALDAIRKLAELPSPDPKNREAERNRIADYLDSHPDSTGADHSTALTLHIIDANAEQRAKLIDGAHDRFFKDKQGNDLLPFVAWCVANAEFQRVLSLLDVNKIKKRAEDEPLLMNYLTALTAVGRLDDLQAIIDDEQVPIKRPVRVMYQTHLTVIRLLSKAENLNQIKAGKKPYDLMTPEERDDLRQKLLTCVSAATADGRLDQLLKLGDYCERLQGFYDIAEDCYRSVVVSKNGRLERQAMQSLLRACRLGGNTSGLRAALRRAVDRWPDDKTFSEESLYIDLLVGLEVEINATRAQLLLSTNSEDAVRKFVSSFGHWRLGDYEQMIEACNHLEVGNLPPGMLAALARMTAEAGARRVSQGDETEYRKSIQSLVTLLSNKLKADRTALLPEESSMLDRAREAIGS